MDGKIGVSIDAPAANLPSADPPKAPPRHALAEDTSLHLLNSLQDDESSEISPRPFIGAGPGADGGLQGGMGTLDSAGSGWSFGSDNSAVDLTEQATTGQTTLPDTAPGDSAPMREKGAPPLPADGAQPSSEQIPLVEDVKQQQATSPAPGALPQPGPRLSASTAPPTMVSLGPDLPYLPESMHDTALTFYLNLLAPSPHLLNCAETAGVPLQPGAQASLADPATLSAVLTSLGLPESPADSSAGSPHGSGDKGKRSSRLAVARNRERPPWPRESRTSRYHRKRLLPVYGTSEYNREVENNEPFLTYSPTPSDDYYSYTPSQTSSASHSSRSGESGPLSGDSPHGSTAENALGTSTGKKHGRSRHRVSRFSRTSGSGEQSSETSELRPQSCPDSPLGSDLNPHIQAQRVYSAFLRSEAAILPRDALRVLACAIAGLNPAPRVADQQFPASSDPWPPNTIPERVQGGFFLSPNRYAGLQNLGHVLDWMRVPAPFGRPGRRNMVSLCRSLSSSYCSEVGFILEGLPAKGKATGRSGPRDAWEEDSYTESSDSGSEYSGPGSEDVIPTSLSSLN